MACITLQIRVEVHVVVAEVLPLTHEAGSRQEELLCL